MRRKKSWLLKKNPMYVISQNMVMKKIMVMKKNPIYISKYGYEKKILVIFGHPTTPPLFLKEGVLEKNKKE